MPPARRSGRTVSSTSARDSAQPYTRANPPRTSTSTSPIASRSSATIARPANGSTSLKLTVKAPPSKLRQATSGSQIPPNPYANDQSESDATPAPPSRPSRATRNPRTVVEPDSDEDEDDAQGEEDEDAEGEVDRELLGNEDDSEEDAEGEDDEMDHLSRDHPPPPVIKQQRLNGQARSNVTASAPTEGPLKSVEDKEMEDDDDDELSELEDLDDLEPENEEENDEEEEEDDEEGSDEDDENSRSATPDLSKLTKRQRGAFSGTEEFDGGLMALSNEALKKKHLTEEEHAMRRQEMARRRKNLSEKRNEEEKMDTINKLLSKPAPKRRTRAEMQALRARGDAAGDDEEDKPEPIYTRWVSNKEGSRLGVPVEWMDAPIGNTFKSGGARLVEEVV